MGRNAKHTRRVEAPASRTSSHLDSLPARAPAETAGWGFPPPSEATTRASRWTSKSVWHLRRGTFAGKEGRGGTPSSRDSSRPRRRAHRVISTLCPLGLRLKPPAGVSHHLRRPRPERRAGRQKASGTFAGTFAGTIPMLPVAGGDPDGRKRWSRKDQGASELRESRAATNQPGDKEGGRSRKRWRVAGGKSSCGTSSHIDSFAPGAFTGLRPRGARHSTAISRKEPLPRRAPLEGHPPHEVDTLRNSDVVCVSLPRRALGRRGVGPSS
jgi:hypothetical protein